VEDRRQVSTRRRGDRRAHALRLLAFLSIVALGFFGFLRMEQLADDIRDEALARDNVACVRANEVRLNIVKYVENLVANSSSPERSAAAVEQARKDFAPAECPPGGQTP
jgi:hypothetical protein